MNSLALGLLLLLVLVAPALADEHAFQHRYVFEGRLIGADDLPIVGREVAVTVDGDDLTTPCDGGHDATTDAWGDFRFCWEHRAIRPGARMNVTAGNATRTVQLDPTFRRAYVALRDVTENGTATPGWNETFRVTGRAWTAGPTVLDGVQLIGTAAPGVPVNLTVNGPGNETSTENATTDAYGDFGFTITALDPRNTTVIVELGGRDQSVLLDETWHRNHAPYLMPTYLDGSGNDRPPSGSGAPGTLTPRVSPWLVVGIVAGLAAAVAYAVLAKRKGER